MIPTFQVLEDWGKLPEGWRYLEAAGVTVDSKDRVYVFARGEHPVIVFDRDGNFVRSWGEGLVKRAHGITIGPDDEVWLTDDANHTIRKFTPEGKLLLTIGDPDNPATLQSGKPFNRPTHVALCPKTGNIYISDGYGNSRVHKYDPNGRHLLSWGEPGTDPGCFNIPHNIATDAEGRPARTCWRSVWRRAARAVRGASRCDARFARRPLRRGSLVHHQRAFRA